MKTNDEAYQNLLSRYEEYQEKKKRRIRIIKRTVPVFACFCFCAILGFSYWNHLQKIPSNLFKPNGNDDVIVEFNVTTTNVSQDSSKTDSVSTSFNTTKSETKRITTTEGIQTHTTTSVTDVSEVQVTEQTTENQIEIQDPDLHNIHGNHFTVTSIFSDVKEEEGYDVSAIQFVYDRKIMVGKTSNIFEPKSNLTREESVQVLYSNEGKPNVDTNNNRFLDVKAGKWYVNAVVWADDNDMIVTYDNDNINYFGVGIPVTREQAVQLLYKYSKLIQCKSIESNIISGASNGCNMSESAKTAMDWAVSYEIISTSSSSFTDPKGNVTRAEFALMIKNLLDDSDK